MRRLVVASHGYLRASRTGEGDFHTQPSFYGTGVERIIAVDLFVSRYGTEDVLFYLFDDLRRLPLSLLSGTNIAGHAIVQ